jgi:formamidopyrimidine-DNA glycosylase
LNVAVPELPDITSYLVALRPRIVGQRVERIAVRSPFLVRTVEPDVFSLEGETVLDLSRIGKRIIWHFTKDRHFVFHLMIAGRLASALARCC